MARPGFKTVIPVTRSESIYELNCGLFALGDILINGSTKLDFPRLPSVLAERKRKGPEWTQINSGITIVEFRMDLDLDLLVLIEHSPPLL